MWLNLFVFVTVAVIVAMTWSEGFWGNALTFINTVFAAMIATNLFEPVADFLEGQAPGFTYFCDFLSLWLVFSVVLGVLRVITDQFSETRLRFKIPVEQAGRALFGLLTAWIVVCFFVFSLHTAPLARHCFGKAFGASPMATNFLMTPDRLWLGFMQSRSETTFSRAQPVIFDPESDFILKYGQRRYQFQNLSKMTIDTRGRGRRR